MRREKGDVRREATARRTMENGRSVGVIKRKELRRYVVFPLRLPTMKRFLVEGKTNSKGGRFSYPLKKSKQWEHTR